MTSIPDCSDKIEQVRCLLEGAERVLVGVGAGLSAAGGLNYADPALAQRLFPEYCAMGLKTITEIMGMFWWISRSKPEAYWGYWAKHIYHMRYASPVLPPYLDLKEILEGQDSFIVSTNVDGQLEKAGIPHEKIFAPQGDYCYFQCAKRCTNDIYYNETMIREMIANMPNALDIRTEDVSMCPRCGAHLVPNLRCDDLFVEKPHIKNLPDYEAFLLGCQDKKTVLLELGVGFNTPVIIRYPFESLTQMLDDVTLVRVNLTDASVPQGLAERSVSLQADLGVVLQALNKKRPS